MKDLLREDDESRPFDAFPAKVRYVTTRAGRVGYMDNGEGPAALFLNGHPLDSRRWGRQLATLADQRWCIAIDSIDLRDEAPLDTDAAYDALAAVLGEFLHALGIGEIDIVVDDGGSDLGLALASLFRSGIRSVVLTSGEGGSILAEIMLRLQGGGVE